MAFDLQNESEIRDGIKKIFMAKEPIDIVVNNAGMAHGALLQMTSMKKLKEVLIIGSIVMHRIIL